MSVVQLTGVSKEDLEKLAGFRNSNLSSTQFKDAIEKSTEFLDVENNPDTMDKCATSLFAKKEVDTSGYVDGYYLQWLSGDPAANAAFKYIIVPVDEAVTYFLTNTLTSSQISIAIYYDINGDVIDRGERGVNGESIVYNKYKIILPAGTTSIGITVNKYKPDAELVYNELITNVAERTIAIESAIKNYWYGKKIVWFGTSIPEGGGNYSYPMLTGQTIGANVINEAKGSSVARNGNALAVTVDDPYGWTGLAWQNVAYSLSADLTEKQKLIDEWDTWKTLLINTPPDTLDLTAQALILDCSWENRLGRHLGDSNRADLYVFDHGHNDKFNELTTVPIDPSNKGYFIGAMNFLITKILEDNPKARICFIGHYENARKEEISQAQEYVANQHSYPLLKLWEKLGWTQKELDVDGEMKTITEIWMPDDVHPSSDTTWEATTEISKHIISFLSNNVK